VVSYPSQQDWVRFEAVRVEVLVGKRAGAQGELSAQSASGINVTG
jgi:hypothetical protein